MKESMKSLQIQTDAKVDLVFENYPDFVYSQMQQLRKLVITTAKATEGITKLEETLKWGEPSFVTKQGSTLRMDWKAKNPEQYALYFQCTSRLVTTFKDLFGEALQFEGKRAIIFPLQEKLPEDIIKQCIKAALRYHKVKHLPTLGI